jgi:hypothetical protein
MAGIVAKRLVFLQLEAPQATREIKTRGLPTPRRRRCRLDLAFFEARDSRGACCRVSAATFRKPGATASRPSAQTRPAAADLRYYVRSDRAKRAVASDSTDVGILMIKRLSPALAFALLIVPIAPAAAQQLTPPPSAFEAPDRMPPGVAERIAPPPPFVSGQTSTGDTSAYAPIPTYGRVGANGQPSGQFYGQPNALTNGQFSNGGLSGQPYGQLSNGPLSNGPVSNGPVPAQP